MLFAPLRSCLLILPLAACATLPSNGPTASRIERDARSDQNSLNFHIVDISKAHLATQAVEATFGDGLRTLDADSSQQRSDVIRPGDTLAISIFEVGVSLFGGVANLSNGLSPQVDDPTANAQRMGVQVDEDGRISLPYVGSISVAGLLPAEVQGIIESRLRGMSQSPQALVTITESIGNGVYLSGAIVKPGRFRLTAARERLLDLIAMAGGSSVEVADAEVRVVRATRAASVRLGDLHPEDANNIILAPGDRVELVKNPRSFTVFGATDKVSQMPFGTPSVSLAEAIARAGGPSDSRANPSRIFLFRFEPGADGTRQQPVIYRLNFMKTESYFLAQRFAVRDKDLIFFSNSASNPPAKFINLINQLFSPFVAASIVAKQ